MHLKITLFIDFPFIWLNNLNSVGRRKANIFISNIHCAKPKILNQQMHYYYYFFFLDITHYNPSKPGIVMYNVQKKIIIRVHLLVECFGFD